MQHKILCGASICKKECGANTKIYQKKKTNICKKINELEHNNKKTHKFTWFAKY